MEKQNNDQLLTSGTPGVTEKDILQFLWENYQMRQSHLWQSLNRLVLAIVSLWAVPFIKVSLFKDLDIFILFFPIVSLLLSLIGKILLNEEYNRLFLVITKFAELFPPGKLPNFKKVPGGKKGRIGYIITVIICNALIICSVVYFFLILAMVFGIIHQPGERLIDSTGFVINFKA